MTFDERVAAVESLGLTSRQARFTVIVALHGGYCMRRQYLQFSGLHYGKNVRDFMDGLVERRLARRQRFLPNRGYVYHLHAKSLYRLLEQTDNRNRRIASAALIARKVMILDAVLAKPDADWYATEDDKVRLFTERFRLPIGILPRRTFWSDRHHVRTTARYFIDKLPICVALEPPTVYFFYLSVDRTTAGFEHFLKDHAELLAYLPSWRIVLATSAMSGPAAQYFSAFDRFKNGALQNASAPPIAELSWFFWATERVARDDLKDLTVADISRFRKLRDRFAATDYRSLYTDWLARGDAALEPLKDQSRPADKFAGGLLVYPLPSRYRQFGSYPGVA